MIILENTQVFNFDGAIRGMRNPMNSWDKSDTDFSLSGMKSICGILAPTIGPNDLDLMKKLIKAGSDHRKFMRQIFVCVDITAPLYWWKEFDTYKVGTVANSCSTMHKIHAKEFTLGDFSHEHLSPAVIDHFQDTIGVLNFFRRIYNEDKSKSAWWQMIQLLPSSYNQKRTITLTYENLINMYHARRNHKLDEWHIYCAWIEELPYAKELICYE